MWYFIALFSSLLWGFADALYERTFDDNDVLCPYKYMVFTGLSAVIVLFACRPFSESDSSVLVLITEYKSFVLIPSSYIMAIICEIKALKNVSQSIVAPVANTSSAFIFIMLVIFYNLMGKTNKAIDQISFWSVSGTILITVGMIALSFVTGENESHFKSGFLLLLLPVFGALFEAFETIFETLFIDDVIADGIGTIDFIRMYSFFVAIISVIFWIQVSLSEKRIYTVRSKKDVLYSATSLCEYLAMIPYCLALDNTPFFTAIISSIYSVFTIIFCRIVNGTRLRKKQYYTISVVMAGILMFAFQ